MTFRYMFVGDRTPHQKLCMWCQEPFAKVGYIHDPNSGLNYCGPDCLTTHIRVSEQYLITYSRLEDAARQVS